MASGTSSKGTWDILSATTFLDPPQDPPRPSAGGSNVGSNGDLILPCGFIIRKGEDPQESDDDMYKTPASSPRKTLQGELSKADLVSGSTGEIRGGSRKRGRPKADIGDETAAERRRTQIRLAQRAYRQRKETAITSLGGRVLELESTIERMNKSFLSFQSEAMKSGVLASHPQLAKQLHCVTQEFIYLANESARNSEHSAGVEGKNATISQEDSIFTPDITPPADQR